MNSMAVILNRLKTLVVDPELTALMQTAEEIAAEGKEMERLTALTAEMNSRLDQLLDNTQPPQMRD